MPSADVGKSGRKLLIATIVLAAALRVIGLATVPPAINQDEAVHAYEAYCLRVTGGDHTGAKCPIFFRCFGIIESHSAPFIWALIPLQAAFGMNVWTTRLPPAILGTLNVWLLFLLVRRWYGSRAALLSAFLLAVSPWHIFLSRIAFEVSICPPLLTLATLLLVMGSDANDSRLDDRPPRHAVVLLLLSGAVFGLTLWTYNAMRVFVPLLLLGGGVLCRGQIRAFVRRSGILAGVSFLCGLCVGVAPFVWACIHTPEQAWGRASTEFILTRTPDVRLAFVKIMRTYAMHFSPHFLFAAGGPSPGQSFPDYGQLHYYCAVLLPLGLVRVISRRRQEKVGLFVVWWLLAGAVAPALTELKHGHSLRAAGMLPAVQILSAIGLDMLILFVESRSRAAGRAMMAVVLAVITVNVAYFLHIVVTRYPAAARKFQAEWQPVVNEIMRRQSQYAAVTLTSEDTNQIGILFLFWSNMHPRQYFSSERTLHLGPEFDLLLRVGKYYFVRYDFFERLWPRLPRGSRLLVAERPGLPVPGAELKRFYHPDGSVAVILYDVTVGSVRR